jgi:hypothetical protein
MLYEKGNFKTIMEQLFPELRNAGSIVLILNY